MTSNQEPSNTSQEAITLDEAKQILWEEFSWISDEKVNNLVIMLSSIIDNVLDSAFNHKYQTHDSQD
jgi:hypothetical protein